MGGTVLGQGICAALVDKGVQVIAYVCDTSETDPLPFPVELKKDLLTVISGTEVGKMTTEILRKIESKYGPIDIYLQDLGIGATEVPEQAEVAVMRQRLEENLNCAQELSNSFIDLMKARASGKIVYIAPWGWDKYAAPIRFETVKAGTIALSCAMAAKLAVAGVTVNCIVPGFIRAVRPLKIEKALKHEVLEEIPSGRLGEIYDVTNSILFLIGDNSKYLTGQTLNISGGL